MGIGEQRNRKLRLGGICASGACTNCCAVPNLQINPLRLVLDCLNVHKFPFIEVPSTPVPSMPVS
jgi:hypothetical protein